MFRVYVFYYRMKSIRWKTLRMAQLSKVKKSQAKGLYNVKGVLYLLRHIKNNIGPEYEYARYTVDKVLDKIRA